MRKQYKLRSVSFENVIAQNSKLKQNSSFDSQQFTFKLTQCCLITGDLPLGFHFIPFHRQFNDIIFYISDKLDSVRDHFESCIR